MSTTTIVQWSKINYTIHCERSVVGLKKGETHALPGSRRRHVHTRTRTDMRTHDFSLFPLLLYKRSRKVSFHVYDFCVCLGTLG